MYAVRELDETTGRVTARPIMLGRTVAEIILQVEIEEPEAYVEQHDEPITVTDDAGNERRIIGAVIVPIGGGLAEYPITVE